MITLFVLSLLAMMAVAFIGVLFSAAVGIVYLLGEGLAVFLICYAVYKGCLYLFRKLQGIRE